MEFFIKRLIDAKLMLEKGFKTLTESLYAYFDYFYNVQSSQISECPVLGRVPF